MKKALIALLDCLAWAAMLAVMWEHRSRIAELRQDVDALAASVAECDGGAE